MSKSKKKIPQTQLMGHIIAGYPNMESSLNAALGICYAGANYLEVQFPFSDPNADGAVIEEACDKSIAQGFKVSSGFALLSTLSSLLKQSKCNTRLIVMTYANVMFHYGIEAFIKEAKKSGAWGIITPDLPIESDEELRKYGKKHHIAIISLIAPKSSTKRIAKVAKISDEIVYVVARAGTTGEKTQLNRDLFDYVNLVRKKCKKPIALGFGINSYEQVKALEGKVDIIVAGSYFVRFINELSKSQELTPQDYMQKLQSHAQNLMGWDKNI